MKAEIITVGTEILLGQIVNTNATYIAQYLADIGYDVFYQTTVGDNEQRLLDELQKAHSRSDLVVLCGGLGPTKDDLTKEVVARHVSSSLEYDEHGLQHVLDFFEGSQRPMTENNKKQGLTIKGGITLQNPAGLACGVLYDFEGTSYVLLPGPPRELQAMMESELKEILINRLPEETHLISRYLRFMGIGESQIAKDLEELMDEQTNPTIAPYANSNEVMLRLTAKHASIETANEWLDNIEERIQARVGEYFYGYGEHNSIENVVIRALSQKGKTISVVEGRTGGACLERLSRISGYEEVCVGGIVLSSDASKQTFLQTDNGEMTRETTIRMAERSRELTGADYGLGVDAIIEQKGYSQPLGKIMVAISTETGLHVEEYMIKRERDYIVDGAVKRSLNQLRQLI